MKSLMHNLVTILVLIAALSNPALANKVKDIYLRDAIFRDGRLIEAWRDGDFFYKAFYNCQRQPYLM